VLDVTEIVEIVNAADVDPAGMTMDEGTTAAEALLVSDTDAPPAGAADDRVTVACVDEPPCTADGLIEIDAMPAAGGVIVSVVVNFVAL
jgi:hypothetical protein